MVIIVYVWQLEPIVWYKIGKKDIEEKKWAVKKYITNCNLMTWII